MTSIYDVKDVLTEADMVRAKQNADVLDIQVGGGDQATWEAPSGEKGVSFKYALREIYAQGGIKDRFDTLAELQNSDLVDGSYALVSEEPENNGLYVKKDGAWSRSRYDVAETLLSALKNTVQNYFKATGYAGKIGALVDANNVPVIVVDRDGQVRLKGLSDSVQVLLSKIAEVQHSYSKKQAKDGSMALFLDANNTPLIKITAAGGARLRGLNRSVQDYLKFFDKIKAKVFEKTDKSDNFLFFMDDNDNVLFKMRADGGVHLIGLKDTIQETLNNLVFKSEALRYKVDDEITPFLVSLKGKDAYSKDVDLSSKNGWAPEVLTLIESAKATYPKVAPLLNNSLPQPFSVGSTWVDEVELTVQNPDDFVNMAGFEPGWSDSIGVVHPNVWGFKDRVAGYKYWLSINPYTKGREEIELPFIYGSNDPDLRDWQLIEGFPAPFEADPINEAGSYRGHLSDAALTYDPLTGDIVYFWRKSLYFEDEQGNRSSDNIYMAARYNGAAWSDIYELVPTGAALSPAILFNPADNLFYLYEQSGRSLYYRTAPNLNGGGWSARQKCNLSHQDGKIWHLEAKFIGGQVVILLHGDNFMSNPNEGDVLYFAVSSDFVNFNVSQSSIIANAEPQIYKSSFLPMWQSDSEAKFKIVYTTDSRTSPQYQLHVTDTNTINLGA